MCKVSGSIPDESTFFALVMCSPAFFRFFLTLVGVCSGGGRVMNFFGLAVGRAGWGDGRGVLERCEGG